MSDPAGKGRVMRQAVTIGTVKIPAADNVAMDLRGARPGEPIEAGSIFLVMEDPRGTFTFRLSRNAQKFMRTQLEQSITIHDALDRDREAAAAQEAAKVIVAKLSNRKPATTRRPAKKKPARKTRR